MVVERVGGLSRTICQDVPFLGLQVEETFGLGDGCEVIWWKALIKRRSWVRLAAEMETERYTDTYLRVILNGKDVDIGVRDVELLQHS
jgi:hypothetical protein